MESISLIVIGVFLLIFIVLYKGYCYEKCINSVNNRVYNSVITPSQSSSEMIMQPDDTLPKYEECVNELPNYNDIFNHDNTNNTNNTNNIVNRQ